MSGLLSELRASRARGALGQGYRQRAGWGDGVVTCVVQLCGHVPTAVRCGPMRDAQTD